MASEAEILAAIDNLVQDRGGGSTSDAPTQVYINGTAPKPELTIPDYIKGFSRSYLAGPTFNFEAPIEAGITAAINRLTGATPSLSEGYNQKLNTIREEQGQFKEAVPYLDNATEIASSILLNPLDKIKKAANGVSTLTKLVTNPASQAGIAGVGSSVSAGDDQSVLGAFTKNAILGGAFSSLFSTVGSALEKTGRNADRLKLSAYNIGNADVAKQLKKLGGEVDNLGNAKNIPVVNTVAKAEREGLINAGDDILSNVKNVATKQDLIGKQVGNIISQADNVIAPSKSFQTNATDKYINSLTGTAKEKAELAAIEEYEALRNQIGNGTLADLQNLKVGLNYKFDQNPYKGDVIKALRSDLRSEIEKRVDDAAKVGTLDSKLAGKIKSLNSQFGQYAELKDVLIKSAPKDLQGDFIEDVIRGGSTTGGTGSMNLASAQSGSPLWSAVGGLLNVARIPENKSGLADVLREFQTPLTATGKVLPEIGTARASQQGFNSLFPNKPSEKTKQEASGNNELDLLNQIDSILKTKKAQPQIEEEDTMPKDKEGIKRIEAQIDQDPYWSTVYEIESSRNPFAKNPKSSAKGAFQLIDATSRKLKVDPLDIEENWNGAKMLDEDNANIIKKKTGIDITSDPALRYSAHFLGAPVMIKLLSGADLNEKEKAQVAELQKKVIPKLEKIYQSKIGGSDYA